MSSVNKFYAEKLYGYYGGYYYCLYCCTVKLHEFIYKGLIRTVPASVCA